MTAALLAADGSTIALDPERWRRDVDDTERLLLAGLVGPVLDIGCGPGRVVAAVAATGRAALGIDTSPAAVAEAAERGVAVLCRSVFEPMPGTGRWRTAVLLDGNIGIGGAPEVLLRRVGELLAPGGEAVVEVEAPGRPTAAMQVQLHLEPSGTGRRVVGPWFPWAQVGADRFGAIATAAGLVPGALERAGDRWFARAARP